MSFAEKWQNLISNTPKSIDNIDKKDPENNFVNIVNEKPGADIKFEPKNKTLTPQESIYNIDKIISQKSLVNIAGKNRDYRVELGGDENKSLPPKYIYNIDKIQCKSIFSSNFLFLELLNEVGAYIRYDHDGTALVFDPPLEGKKADPKRWAYALDLESLFYQLVKS